MISVSGRDIVVVVGLVGAVVAVCLNKLSPEQFLAVLTLIFGYYFGRAEHYVVYRRRQSRGD